MTRYAYLHGLASSPLASKAVRLAAAFEARGLALERPDLNVPSFGELTVTAMLGAVDRMAAGGAPGDRWCLVGSSLGAYVTALWAARNPDRVDRVVLLAPAFDLPSRWPVLLGPAVLGRWRREGWIPLPDATGTPTPFHWGFNDDVDRYPSVPEMSCPALVVHGTRDEVLPVEGSRAYAAARPRCRYVEVDDDHRLLGALDRVEAETLAFLGVDEGASGDGDHGQRMPKPPSV